MIIRDVLWVFVISIIILEKIENNAQSKNRADSQLQLMTRTMKSDYPPYQLSCERLPCGIAPRTLSTESTVKSTHFSGRKSATMLVTPCRATPSCWRTNKRFC